MPPFDFREFLGKKQLPTQTDQVLMKDYSDSRWADFGRAVHNNIMSERWVTAVNTACMSAGSSAQPIHHIARCLRAYVFSGAITR